MLVRSGHALEVIGRSESAVAGGVKLIGLPGVDWARDAEEVTYLFTLLFDAHEIVFAEDTPTESLLPRPHILGSFGPEAEAETGPFVSRAGTDRRAARAVDPGMTPLRPGWPTATCAAPCPSWLVDARNLLPRALGKAGASHYSASLHRSA